MGICPCGGTSCSQPLTVFNEAHTITESGIFMKTQPPRVSRVCIGEGPQGL